MSTAHRLLILHLSDLHFGLKSRFGNGDHAALGRHFHDQVSQAIKHLTSRWEIDSTRIPSAPDLVVVSGDIAHTAHKSEYAKAADFLKAYQDKANLDHRRFLFVPGNHDVSRNATHQAVLALQAEEETPQEATIRQSMDRVMFGPFEQFIADFHGQSRSGLGHAHLTGGGWVQDFPELLLSVGLVNSCEKLSHRKEDQTGTVSPDQIQSLLEQWQQEKTVPWLKLLVLHHNPRGTVNENVDKWRTWVKQQTLDGKTIDDAMIDRMLSDIHAIQGADELKNLVEQAQVQLVLHGHHHAQSDQIWPWKSGGVGSLLGTGSLGVKEDALPPEHANSCQLILLEADAGELRRCQLTFNPHLMVDGQVTSGGVAADSAQCNSGCRVLTPPTNWRRTTPTPEATPATELPPTADYNPNKRPFFIPFSPKGDAMVGRKEVLRRVRQQLLQGRTANIGQTALLQGLGGLGKTQLAVEYVFTFREEYPEGVIWLTADQSLDAQLVKLSEDSKWVSPHSEQKYKLEAALKRLKDFNGLLVIDNLENQERIRDYLPQFPAKPHILVTSRIEQTGYNLVDLDPLGLDDALILLTQEAGDSRAPNTPQEKSAAKAIAAALDGLPLALELAGAYLRQRRAVGWHGYRQLLDFNLAQALPKKLASLTNHDADLYATLKIAEAVFDEEPRLLEVLDLLTWSGSAPMGQSLMAAMLGVEEVELINALGLGVGLRILQQSADRYAIHRLVRQVRREEGSLEGRETWIKSLCQRMCDWFQERREDFTNLSQYEAELDHLTAWQAQVESREPSLYPRMIWLQAYPPYHWGRYRESKVWLEKALAFFQNANGADDHLKAHLLRDLGTIVGQLGDNRQILKLSNDALAIMRSVHGEEHLDTAAFLSDVGFSHKKNGNHKESLVFRQWKLITHRFSVSKALFFLLRWQYGRATNCGCNQAQIRSPGTRT